ncbi:MAG: succinyldiaminopimelate transaminase [Burkholderiaceae bacterium]|jgi:N-succinyldiaminopimelate aminotransferase
MFNPRLVRLEPYPFEKLRALFSGVVPNPALRPINLSIGEPKHPTPALIKTALTESLGGLATYPTTLGAPELRAAICDWIQRRYDVVCSPATQILPVLGSREALFALAQTVLDPADDEALVLCPNPFYQIYEGAALLGGAQPVFLNTDVQGRSDFAAVSPEVWRRVRLVYVCTPGNPAGAVLTLDQWRLLFDAADRHGFVIASDECYSEIFFDETQPPLGGLKAAALLGRPDFQRLIIFSSLSKRSNAPGLRSGFVAGDAAVLQQFLLYRTYHGSAMSPAVQNASIAAWNDDAHVRDNRAAYRAKFDAVLPILEKTLEVYRPDAGFYVWAKVPDALGNDQTYAVRVLHDQNVTVLPGSFLARTTEQGNPGTGFVRIALVAPLDDCVEAAERLLLIKEKNE